ncbi:MAG: Yip1 family protein, partial [Candidatus Heimdallarchaeaceae archaeon]
MKKNVSEPEEQEDLLKYTPLQRLLGHHLLDKQSFTNMPKAYMIAAPIIILALILALNFINFTILSSKMQLVPTDENILALFKESIYFGVLLSIIPQILLWAIIVHGLMIFLGGKGKFLKSLSIYSIAQIPIALGLIILTIVASARTQSIIYPYGFP